MKRAPGPDDERPVLDSRPRGGRRREDVGPQSVGDLLVPMMAKLGLKTRARHLQVLGMWRDVVGDMVAEHTRPATLVRGRLIVDTDSPAMGHQLHLQAQLILDRLNERLGEPVVREIRFRHASATPAARGRHQ